MLLGSTVIARGVDWDPARLGVFLQTVPDSIQCSTRSHKQRHTLAIYFYPMYVCRVFSSGLRPPLDVMLGSTGLFHAELSLDTSVGVCAVN